MSSHNSLLVPVITIDGPTASGKGTIAQHVAQALGWHVLDSGALYRIAALIALEQNIADHDTPALAAAATGMDVRFPQGRILLSGRDITDDIRQERVGNMASAIATHVPLRSALLARQHAFRQAPGLVADGRDMGTVVFPDAPLKIFLEASPEARALRRCKQLKEKGIPVNLAGLTEDMRARDARDRMRASAPLAAASDAAVIDSSELGVQETVDAVLGLWSGLGVRSKV